MSFDELLRRQRFQESRFKAKAYNKKTEATGIAQFRPIALEEAKRLGFTDESTTMDDLYNPTLSIDLQEKYMNWISKRPYIKKGNKQVQLAKALIAYNYGPDNTRIKLNELKARGIDINNISFIDHFNEESKNYVKNILLNEGDFEKRYTKELTKPGTMPLIKKRGGYKAQFCW